MQDDCPQRGLPEITTLPGARDLPNDNDTTLTHPTQRGNATPALAASLQIQYGRRRSYVKAEPSTFARGANPHENQTSSWSGSSRRRLCVRPQPLRTLVTRCRLRWSVG